MYFELNMSQIDIDNLTLGQPVWRLATRYPGQGSWTEADYFELEGSGGPLVEFDDGIVEVHDMPTIEHQRILKFVYRILDDFVESNQLGEVLFAPLPVKLWGSKYREPDIIYLAKGRSAEKYPEGADMVVEIVSPGDVSRTRDLKTKLIEYAEAKIGEYWIIDPEQQRVLVGRLENRAYKLAEFGPGQKISSQLLAGIQLEVTAILDAVNK